MKSFLVIDDDPGLTALYELLIKKRYNGASVCQAYNGKEALKKTMRSDYSVIISDVNMPKMNGIDFHNELKKKSSITAKKIAFISSAPDIPYFNKEKIPYLLKPFLKDDFYSLIDSILYLEEKQLMEKTECSFQRKHERKGLKEECILEPLNIKLKSKVLIKGTIIDISEGGFGFVSGSKGLSNKLKAKVFAESIGANERKAELVWSYRANEEFRSGFRWTC